MTAQGKQHASRTSVYAALGVDIVGVYSPERAEQRWGRTTRRVYFALSGLLALCGVTQGGSKARATRLALPWADLLKPSGLGSQPR